MEPSKTATPGTIELVARSVDLTTSLINASNTTNGTIQLTKQISRWLEHERLDEAELMSFFTKSRDLTWPNGNGNIYRNSILESPYVRQLAPKIRLRQSGSLGRLLTRDSSLCWVVSTAACLFQCYGVDDVSEAITKMVIQRQLSAKPGERREEGIYVAELQTKPLVKKLVESIMLNVFNSGNNIRPLPQQLNDLCQRGHNLGGKSFGIVTHTLQEPRPRVIIQTNHLLRDLTFWLIYHFYGRLVITVCDKIFYDVQLGDSQREIEMKIPGPCDPSGNCDVSGPGSAGTYRILEAVPGRLRSIKVGRYTSQRPEPQVRHELYSFTPLFAHRPPELCLSGRNLARRAAQAMMKWLLTLSVTKSHGGLRFEVAIEDETPTVEETFKISDMLKRRPQILNKLWDDYPATAPVYSNPKRKKIGTGGRQTAPVVSRQPTLNELITYFPILQDLVRQVGQICLCVGCRVKRQTDRPILEGCRRYSAVFEVVMLLAHGIADAFGVNDVSARQDTENLLDGMITLFMDLVEEELILWNNWFSIAATLLLGCPYPTVDNKSSLDTLCAVQYGNMVAIADWLSLYQELKMEGCFSLVSAEGKLGALAGDRPQYIDQNYAVVLCQHQLRKGKYDDLFPKTHEKRGEGVQLLDDFMAVDVDVVLIHEGEHRYIMLTQARSNSHRRIVDPGDALIGALQHFRQVDCTHTGIGKRQFVSDGRIKLYDLEEMLGRWPGWEAEEGEEGEEEEEGEEGGKAEEEEEEEEEGGKAEEEEEEEEEGKEEQEKAEEEEGFTLHLTHHLDTILKLNIAHALTVDRSAIINMDECCQKCAIAEARALPCSGHKGSSGSDLYIINAISPPNGSSC